MKIITISTPKIIKTLSCVLCLMSSVSFVNAQPVINIAPDSLAATQLVGKVLIGTGVSFSNVTYSGQFVPTLLGGYPGYQIGSFHSFGAPNTNLGINSGIIMSNGSVSRANQPNVYKGYGYNGNSDNNYYEYFCICEANHGDVNCVENLDHCQWSDADLDAICGCPGSTFDAVSLEFDFTPSFSPINFKYVFASDEYPDFVCSTTNDIFAFLVSGPNPRGGVYNKTNIALVPGKNEPVSINTINSGTCGQSFPPCGTCDMNNSKFYVNNLNGKTIVYNGFTTVLTATLNVVPCQTYHMKIALADVADDAYDSSLFIEGSGFSIPFPTIAYVPPDDTAAIKGCTCATVTFSTLNHMPVQKDSAIAIGFGGGTLGADFTTNANIVNDSIHILKGQSSVSFQVCPLCPGTKPGQDFHIMLKQRTCSIEEDFPIKVIDPKHFPPIKATPNTFDTSIYSGGKVMLSITNVTGGVKPNFYSYSWSPAASLNTSTGSTVIASPTANTTYTVTIKDSCKTCNVNTINIIVKVTASIKENSQNLLIFSVIPNPFNNNTIISFRLPETGFVSIKVYDLLGNEIKTLVNKTMNKGVNKVEFEASGMESGMYYYRLNAGKQTASGMLILIK